MIKTTRAGSTVWFRMEADPDMKIEWDIQVYLARMKVIARAPELRAELIKIGKISPMTEEEVNECKLGWNYEVETKYKGMDAEGKVVEEKKIKRRAAKA